MSKYFTLRKAIDISIKRWEYIVSNDGSKAGQYQAVPGITNLHSGCGLCEWRMLNKRAGAYLCTDNMKNVHCPLFLAQGHRSCDDTISPWMIWSLARNKETAEQVLNKLKEIKDDYERRGYKIVKA